MSLVSKVGRRRPRARIALATLYLILSIGAITTLYPFVLMLSTGLKGPTDQNSIAIVPEYFGDDKELLTKYLDDKYSGEISQIAASRISGDSSLIPAYKQFLEKLPVDQWKVGFRMPPGQVNSRLNMRYQAWLRSKFNNVKELNEAYLEENVAIQTVTPPAELLERVTWKPSQGSKYADWLQFKATLPAEFRIPIRRDRLYQEWLRTEHKNRIEDVRAELNPTNEKTFEAVHIPVPEPAQFTKAVPERYRETTADRVWHQEHLESMPIVQYEEAFVKENAKSIRNEFAGRNYRFVVDYVLLHGRAVLNTVLFCGLAILTQLIVNPLAAYALSRYPIKASGKVLIFLLATMAFPAEVTMIPSFLLLKDLNLLNTFAALVLPSAASGYMIFLLKGFFDSLPNELYEAGQMDGAKETTLLTKIALPLSKPVLGYMALMAFMSAYSTFMFAFLVVQDQKMWTLMVWIYQLQTTAPKSVVMAALSLAALPTLVVFLFAQKVIMRGIVLPGEK